MSLTRSFFPLQLLSEIEMARLDSDPADRLASSLSAIQSSAIDLDLDLN